MRLEAVACNQLDTTDHSHKASGHVRSELPASADHDNLPPAWRMTLSTQETQRRTARMLFHSGYRREANLLQSASSLASPASLGAWYGAPCPGSSCKRHPSTSRAACLLRGGRLSVTAMFLKRLPSVSGALVRTWCASRHLVDVDAIELKPGMTLRAALLQLRRHIAHCSQPGC